MFDQKPRLRTILLASAALTMTAAPVMAQQADSSPQPMPQEGQAQIDDVVVTGLRATQRNSIEFKRSAAVIVDAIVNDEIGSLPDNSVGDTLERVTGVTADRFKGNANELSVRGLGPTLSFSTFNGREVSTAGPDRSVAFQQFPSELVNGVLVYKSQQADFVDGGIAGVIELRSIRPLEAKPRLQFEYRGVYQEKDAAINGRDGLGYRANVSWTNRWLNTGAGDFGVSLGYQHQDQASPEDYYITNSAFIPCSSDALNPSLVTGTSAAQTAAGASFNCGLRGGMTTAQRAGTTDAPLYFATTSRTFRQNATDETRDGFMGALQWRPTERLDFLLDTQYSKRSSLENRNQLAITEAARGIEPIIIGDGGRYSEGALISYRGNSNLEIQTENRLRDEEYRAAGLSGRWNGDRLQLSGDLSYSESHRTETQKATNMRSPTRVAYTLDASADVVPTVDFGGFDITNPASFLTTTIASNTNYARYRLATDRRDKIAAVRFDGVYDLSQTGFFRTLNMGVRYSEHERKTDLANNGDVNTPIARDGLTAAQLVAQANQNCRVAFPASEFMTESTTNVRSWASFDNDCLFRTYTGRDTNPLMADSRGPEDIDVKETIGAAYLMTTFGGELRNTPFSGNFGLRYVKTDVDSRGYRSEVLVTPSVGGSAATITTAPGTLSEVRGKGSYDYWLPSANVNFDLSDRTRLRFGVSRSIARSGIEDFNVGINPQPDTTATTVQGVLANSQTGNPNLKPLDSWNLDASIEYYLNRDTAFSFAIYQKWIKNASFDAVQPFTTSIIANGVETTFNAVAPANDTAQRQLTGFEVTGGTVFSQLPGLWSGLGVSGGYNYADADFEFPDPSTVAPYVAPAGLRGLSRHNFNASVFWEGSGLQLRAAYRYRSEYSKPNSSTNRSVRGSGILNLSANYNINRNVQLKLQALNVTNARDIMFKPGYDAVTEVSESNPQYYFGVRFRY
ncbi:TonB dependent receptor [Brevundimonas sp. SH203]|uniref:TonB-dependent receptor n=1 Tax=Brevundimonas sp. SH203 TaxID=345167 RepID=UPI0009D427F6|nr:TonB-dependent receptor [Brevundimonas sp. SH203]GAW41137.1 TonB dependent receptor [Brevundimonas sp. SH203]